MTEAARAWEPASEWPRAIARMFERNLAAATPGLAVPVTTEPARARRIVALLVETLGGYAFGLVAGELGRAVSTWFGAGPAGRVRGAARATAPHTHVASTFDDAKLALELVQPRDLAGELVAALPVRLALVGEQLAELVDDATRALPSEPQALAALTSQLSTALERDDRLAVEILTGWRHACAVIERRAPDVEASPRARELWRTWSQLAGQLELEPAGERDLVMRIG